MICVCVDQEQVEAASSWFKDQEIQVTRPIDAKTPNGNYCKHYGVSNSNDEQLGARLLRMDQFNLGFSEQW